MLELIKKPYKRKTSEAGEIIQQVRNCLAHEQSGFDSQHPMSFPSPSRMIPDYRTRKKPCDSSPTPK